MPSTGFGVACPMDAPRELDRISGSDTLRIMASERGPSLGKRAWTFSQAAVRHLLDGARKVSGETLEERLTACQSCAAFDAPDPDGSPSCTICGCFVDVKASWASERCPLGKWKEGAA